ncbi:MAG: c-type cytochrome [Bacteroidetes bacterium]|nr:c-type cytochrome [Bacteroidota bacterium]
MKKLTILSLLAVLPILLSLRYTPAAEDLIPVPASVQQPGDAALGYEYLTTGDFLKSGVPYSYFIMANGKNTTNYLNRSDRNANVGPGYNVITHDGVDMVIPTCLQCHAETFEDKLIIGLGNTRLDFSSTSKIDVSSQINVLRTLSPKQYNKARPFFDAFTATYPYMETEVRGVNPADRLAMVLVAHRDPQSLRWSDAPMIMIPEQVIPTDVPAWWLMKKKNAMFYSGFGRGDLAKFLMLSNLLTVSDTLEAREVSSHFGNVLAYIRSLEPPKYPGTIDKVKAEKGRVVFNDNCSRCHGTYGADGQYPNLLVPLSTIATDSLLCYGVQQSKPFVDWFNQSWFVQGDNPAQLVPFNGYIAPPLDGVWITAPYLHNGSVPTLEAVLNSKLRPQYWQRNFSHDEYDINKPGIKYTALTVPEAKHCYNTTLPGYGNMGHYFGDALTDDERKNVLEYLKTL